MSGFTKLFGTLVTSTIWREGDKTRIVWITMLALADKNGYVAASIPGLAAIANVTIDECTAALEILHGPDKYSRTQDHDGRRAVATDGGWILLNYAKYRELGRSVDRTEYLRIKQAESRDRKSRQPVSTIVNPYQPISEAEDRGRRQIQIGVGSKRADTFSPDPTAPSVVMTFPASGRSATWDLTQEWLDAAVLAFPGIDVLADLRIALGKIKTGACRKPTGKGMSRFLMGWLGRTNDSSRGDRTARGRADSQQTISTVKEWISK